MGYTDSSVTRAPVICWALSVSDQYATEYNGRNSLVGLNKYDKTVLDSGYSTVLPATSSALTTFSVDVSGMPSGTLLYLYLFPGEYDCVLLNSYPAQYTVKLNYSPVYDVVNVGDTVNITYFKYIDNKICAYIAEHNLYMPIELLLSNNNYSISAFQKYECYISDGTSWVPYSCDIRAD
jgi:hypothetical protein